MDTSILRMLNVPVVVPSVPRGGIAVSILRMLNVLVVVSPNPRGGIAGSSFDCGRAVAGERASAVVALSRPVNADFALGRGRAAVRFGSD